MIVALNGIPRFGEMAPTNFEEGVALSLARVQSVRPAVV